MSFASLVISPQRTPAGWHTYAGKSGLGKTPMGRRLGDRKKKKRKRKRKRKEKRKKRVSNGDVFVL
jgi:hypothetical protein